MNGIITKSGGEIDALLSLSSDDSILIPIAVLLWLVGGLSD